MPSNSSSSSLNNDDGILNNSVSSSIIPSLTSIQKVCISRRVKPELMSTIKSPLSLAMMKSSVPPPTLLAPKKCPKSSHNHDVNTGDNNNDDDNDDDARYKNKSYKHNTMRFKLKLKSGATVSWRKLVTQYEYEKKNRSIEDKSDHDSDDDENAVISTGDLDTRKADDEVNLRSNSDMQLLEMSDDVSIGSYYDTDDSFIDDSEIFDVDEANKIETSVKGFFVQSGDIAIVNKNEKTQQVRPQKSKMKRSQNKKVKRPFSIEPRSANLEDTLFEKWPVLCEAIKRLRKALHSGFSLEPLKITSAVENALMKVEDEIRTLKPKQRTHVYVFLSEHLHLGAPKSLKVRMKKMYTHWIPIKYECSIKKVMLRLKNRIRKDVRAFDAAMSSNDHSAPNVSHTKKTGEAKYRCRWEIFANDLLLIHDHVILFVRATNESRKKKVKVGQTAELLSPGIVRRSYFKILLDCWSTSCAVSFVNINEAFKRYLAKRDEARVSTNDTSANPDDDENAAVSPDCVEKTFISTDTVTETSVANKKRCRPSSLRSSETYQDMMGISQSSSPDTKRKRPKNSVKAAALLAVRKASFVNKEKSSSEHEFIHQNVQVSSHDNSSTPTKKSSLSSAMPTMSNVFDDIPHTKPWSDLYFLSLVKASVKVTSISTSGLSTLSAPTPCSESGIQPKPNVSSSEQTAALPFTTHQ